MGQLEQVSFCCFSHSMCNIASLACTLLLKGSSSGMSEDIQLGRRLDSRGLTTLLRQRDAGRR